ncbi:glycerol-3-phosphate dehydrogenase/oxidase [Desulfurispora thermophila]|uniref:glycerol-3-phosphate dehydrogenase/oxidase n=1 Tax=Desulfurispora thermophila TaxID=265470 RepID=UPI000373E1F4|nr:glycerol-3-phosphate dehydrogenase/oxidase [Desulfurispora thermophila]
MEWRHDLAHQLAGPWDLVVIGGGISGVAILWLAAEAGLKALLLEQKDFAWGTSSRSGKLVHGGLRYLRHGQFGLTRAAVREREWLLRAFPALVQPQSFVIPFQQGEFLLPLSCRLGLAVYDRLAGRKSRSRYNSRQLEQAVPLLAVGKWHQGLAYLDARTDDARLVMQVLLNALACGGRAVNYVRAVDLLIDRAGRVCGLVARDEETGNEFEISARVVINATGAWVDSLRRSLGREPLIRPLRGSHLIFSAHKIPLEQGINLFHPRDRRPLYIFPWLGAVLVGTTDLDHRGELSEEPCISYEEKEYLLEAVQFTFPHLGLSEKDVLATFAGVRPVVGSGKKDPSREKRDMLVKDESGLITVTGGKLTTFRLMAQKALAMAGIRAAGVPGRLATGKGETEAIQSARLELPRIFWNGATTGGAGGPDDLIAGTPYTWRELAHVAAREMVVHLDDLLLRRLRLGILLPDGGAALLPGIKERVLALLGWNEDRWQEEVNRYLKLRQSAYSLPAGR